VCLFFFWLVFFGGCSRALLNLSGLEPISGSFSRLHRHTVARRSPPPFALVLPRTVRRR